MAIEIKVNNKSYCDKVQGIQFNKGVAVVEDEAHGIKIAKRLGYEYEKVKEKTVDKPAEKKADPKPKAKTAKKAVPKK